MRFVAASGCRRCMHESANLSRDNLSREIGRARRNERAVGLYGRLGMSVIGSNTTFLGKAGGTPALASFAPQE